MARLNLTRKTISSLLKDFGTKVHDLGLVVEEEQIRIDTNSIKIAVLIDKTKEHTKELSLARKVAKNTSAIIGEDDSGVSNG